MHFIWICSSTIQQKQAPRAKFIQWIIIFILSQSWLDLNLAAFKKELTSNPVTEEKQAQ